MSQKCVSAAVFQFLYVLFASNHVFSYHMRLQLFPYFIMTYLIILSVHVCYRVESLTPPRKVSGTPMGKSRAGEPDFKSTCAALRSFVGT